MFLRCLKSAATWFLFIPFLLVPKEGLTTAKDEKEEKAAETGGLASSQGYVDLGKWYVQSVHNCSIFLTFSCAVARLHLMFLSSQCSGDICTGKHVLGCVNSYSTFISSIGTLNAQKTKVQMQSVIRQRGRRTRKMTKRKNKWSRKMLSIGKGIAWSS